MIFLFFSLLYSILEQLPYEESLRQWVSIREGASNANLKLESVRSVYETRGLYLIEDVY